MLVGGCRALLLGRLSQRAASMFWICRVIDSCCCGGRYWGGTAISVSKFSGGSGIVLGLSVWIMLLLGYWMSVLEEILEFVGQSRV